MKSLKKRGPMKFKEAREERASTFFVRKEQTRFCQCVSVHRIDAMAADGDCDRDADLVEEAVDYISEHKYPEGCSNSRKRQIRKKAEKFILQDDKLYYKAGKDKPMVKYIKNKSDQLRIAKSCHVDPTSGHLGLKKTVYRVRERYMWKGVWNDVKNIVTTCNECQKVNKNPLVTVPELHPVPVRSPWYHVGMDFVGPIHRISRSGFHENGTSEGDE